MSPKGVTGMTGVTDAGMTGPFGTVHLWDHLSQPVRGMTGSGSKIKKTKTLKALKPLPCHPETSSKAGEAGSE